MTHREILISLLAGGLSAGLAGCSTVIVQAYAPPSGKDKAEITFRNDGYQTMGVYFYKGAERCTARMGRLKVIDNKLVTSIPTDAPTAFSVYGIIGTDSIGLSFTTLYCETSVSLKADSTKKYAVSIRPSKDKTCAIKVSEARISEPDSEGPATIQIHESIPTGRVLSEAGPFCRPA